MHTLIRKFQNIKPQLTRFFEGKLYPALVCLAVVVGAIFKIEMFLVIPIILSAVLSLLLSDTLKPLLISLLTFMYQIPLAHAPCYPVFSDYYGTGWRIVVLIILGALLLFAIGAFVFRTRLYRRATPGKTPLFYSTAALAIAFLCNGLFSSEYTFGNLAVGFFQGVCFFVLFLLFYHGLTMERAEELTDYLTYLTLLISYVLILLVAHLFLFGGVITDGSIQKDMISLGFGVCNSVGYALAVLIPLNFYGFMREEKQSTAWLYFVTAVLVYLCAILTLSRNALLFGSIMFLTCAVIALFHGKRRRAFRIVFALGAAAVLLLILLLWGKISTVFSNFFSQGFSDNGRFDIWRNALVTFLEHPIFGGGFYAVEASGSAIIPAIPEYAHQTLLQLLASMGIAGALSYLVYRIDTVRVFLRSPSLAKTMLALSMLMLILESLLDNFLFHFHTTFYYNLALVIALKHNDEARQEPLG